MLPIVCAERLEKPGGLWTSKLSGSFTEGEASVTKFYVEGKVDIKELGGHLKVFFKGIKLIVRGVQQVDKKKKTTGDGESDEESSSDEEAGGKRPDTAVTEDGKPADIGKIPKLHVFMTTKKPKKRMVDAHKTGAQLKLTGVNEGIFGNDKDTTDYEAVIVNVVDIFAYQGIVVLKLPQDEPTTEEPIIYGYVKLLSYRSIQIRTIDALHLNDLSNMLNKLTSLNEIGSASMALGPHSKKLIKPFSVYRNIAEKAFLKYGKTFDDFIDFNDLQKILDLLDFFFLTVQAKRLFNIFDFKKIGKISLIEFENLLIAKDLLHELSKEIQLLDVYDSLKTDPVDEDAVLAKLEAVLVAYELEQHVLLDETNKVNAMIGRPSSPLPPPVGGMTPATTTTTTIPPIPGTEKPKREISLVAVVKQKRRALEEERKKKKYVKIKEQGLDYSGFIEAIQLLGYSKKLKREEEEDEETLIKNAFCIGGGIKEKDIDLKYLTIDEFRKCFIKLADLSGEFKKRNMKLEGGLFSDDRNLERLYLAILETEELYMTSLQQIPIFIENLKSEYRQKKDEKSREKASLKEKLLHNANKFIAQRAQEKRLLIKKEQEEKSRKRIDDKVLKNKLLLRQQENEKLKRLEIIAGNEEKELLKLSEIRQLGYDQLDLSIKELHEIPITLYLTKESKIKLSYLQLLDLSHNMIEELPKNNFFYHCSELKKLSISQNRLKILPNDLLSCTKLEILEINSNRLSSLPTNLGIFIVLQRLNVYNNNLTELPLSIGLCVSLKYLNIHSNRLTSLPNTLGSCFQLEYLDVSCNQLKELPEDLQYLVSLIHCDFNHNNLSSLPQHLGNCLKLQYLDLSINQITAIPESFGNLLNLEYINMENNSLIITSHCYSFLKNVKSLNLKRNAIRLLSNDFGNLHLLMFCDLSMNSLISLPIEIGLLKNLQTLLLSHNSLTTLPLEIGSCISLQLLDISYNGIHGMLPETMGIIYSLIELNISFNDINELPESIVGFQEVR
jgi:Leucine-rich repeat (LRR) protein